MFAEVAKIYLGHIVTSKRKRDENPNLRQDFSWCPWIMNYKWNKKQESSEERMQENNKNTSIRCGLGCQNAKLKYVYVMVNKAIYPFSSIQNMYKLNGITVKLLATTNWQQET